MHKINETHSLTNLQDLIPTLAGIIIGNTNYLKWGLDIVDLLENVFNLVMHECNHLAEILFAWTDTNSIASTAFIMGSQQFLS